MLDETRLYSLTEARPYLGCGRTTLYRAIRGGQLRAVKIGRCTRLMGRDIAAFQAGLVSANPSPDNR